MIGRADIEGSKSNVAMNAWLPGISQSTPRLTPSGAYWHGSDEFLARGWGDAHLCVGDHAALVTRKHQIPKGLRDKCGTSGCRKSVQK